MFHRVLIANRGEVAVRDHPRMPGARDRDRRRLLDGRPGRLHVRMADRAVHIGPPPPAESYLQIASLVAAGTTTGCDAVHPGWGFLAENADFARACEDNDLVFVGPTPETIETMGDKVRAKETVAAAGLPLVPGSEGSATLDEVRALGQEIGFPLLLKAAAGGGGRGMRLVATTEELEGAYRMAVAEAEASFGDGSMYIERRSSARVTSRSRCWATGRAASSLSASATARSSGATRS